MPKSTKKSVPQTPDEELADHLEQAETHLIGAVEQFGQVKKPVRDDIYLKRLRHAQETVSHLYMQELVRKRGLFRTPRRKKAS